MYQERVSAEGDTRGVKFALRYWCLSNYLFLEKRKKEKKNWGGFIIIHQNRLDSLQQESGKALPIGNICLHSMCKSSKV